MVLLFNLQTSTDFDVLVLPKSFAFIEGLTAGIRKLKVQSNLAVWSGAK